MDTKATVQGSSLPRFPDKVRPRKGERTQRTSIVPSALNWVTYAMPPSLRCSESNGVALHPGGVGREGGDRDGVDRGEVGLDGVGHDGVGRNGVGHVPHDVPPGWLVRSKELSLIHI